MDCPKCNTEVAEDPRFVPWCSSCEWGLDTSRPEPKGRLAKRSERLNVKLSDRLFAQVTSDSAARVTNLRVITLAAAVAVHVVTAGLFVFGILLFFISSSFGHVIQYVAALILILLAIAVQPVNFKRLVRPPKPTGIRLDRTSAPALFGCLDQIAEVVGTKTPDVVLVGSEFNASILTEPRGKIALRFGMSLWFALTWPERVAILGHELAHRVNGDLRNGRLVGTAVLTLHRWAWLFRPAPRMSRTLGNSRGSLVILGELLAPLILLPISLTILGIATVLRVVSNRQGQRSEYVADKLASEVGGSVAAASALEKLSLASSVGITLSRTVKFKQSDKPWVTLQEYVGSIPPGEHERLRRVGARRYEQIDATHPPNFMRAEAIRRRPEVAARVFLDKASQNQIAAELAEPADRAGRALERFYGV